VDDTARRTDVPSPAGAEAATGNETKSHEQAQPAGLTRQQRPADELQHTRDRALIDEALAGNTDAFNELVLLYQDYLFSLCVRVVNDRDAAADAVQEAFFSAYRNLARFRGDSFRSWLTRIALNAATDVLRLRKRRPSEPYPEWEDEAWQPPADESDAPERQAVRRDAARALSRALSHITADQRTAIVLYDVEGYDYQEIADLTNVSLGTVKSRIHRGRLALREVLATAATPAG
jgi:RNA polymerase sigma factor (sigma-70 family)